ncbi:uncharacterized protein M421DRAFT_1621 [Didymella exigua CBS 183.55]|uniref:Uncharacterized protein n=1 Tax=Didymella exigua CBS 183.55 TaxID=1150837 RepID=A0A6A5RZU4_9PLEO|nr:uncharacterized protein M421DRAFT_1621 [Didymella exigua CBS 183.55]KAF1933059.1 hypothetical protein M421DRAFT_1621 [Didymella exigua CBS 183.55]
MFQFQSMNTTKRRRDDDSDSEDERNLKKSRPVYLARFNHGFAQSPLHINVGPSLPPSPPAATSHNSMHNEQTQESTWGGPVLSSNWQDVDYSMDMEEDDSQSDVRSQPPESPFGNHFFRPPTLNPSSSLHSENGSTGRISTPIHPTFNRGGMSGFGYPSSGSAGSMTSNALPPLSSLTVRKSRQDQPHDRSRSRRMPSPISEDEDIPDTPTALTQSQLSRLSVSREKPEDMDMDKESAATSLTLPLTPRGRKRSGALTGTPRFSMGYRDDCEKCKQRVPGHYSHFLP